MLIRIDGVLTKVYISSKIIKIFNYFGGITC